MSSLLDQDLEPTDDVFHAHCDNPASIYYVLKSLVYKEKTKLFCTVSATNNGLKVAVESHKSFQGIAFLCRPMFSEWDLRVDTLDFRIGLVDFMESINCIHTKNAVVKFSMKDEKKDIKDRRLNIIIIDRKCKAKVSLPVYNPGAEFDFNFHELPVRAKIFLEAKTIKKVFQEVDAKENPCVSFTFQPDLCIITTNADTLKATTFFPKHSTEVIDIECDEDELNFDYKSIFIKRLRYATSNAAKVKLSMNDHGVLCAQFKLAKVDGNTALVEFYANPLDPVVEESA